MGTENEIVFEDLHGVHEDKPLEVDLDADTKDDGIRRAPADDAADDDTGDDDDGALAAADDDDDSSDDAGDDAAASSDDEDDAYSKKVKARIDRERRQTQKARDEAKYWRDQAEKMAKDTSKRDRDQLAKSIEQAEAQIESTQAELESAIEGGNTKDQVRLTSKLTDLKAEKIQAELRLSDLPEDGNVPPFDGKVTPPSENKQTLAQKWVEDRSDWYQARGFEKYTRMANRLDKEVYRDGFDPDTDEYFEELDRRLKKAAPVLYDDDKDLTPDEDAGKNRNRKKVSPVAGVDTGASSRRSGKGSKVELTEADFANMRRFNLNTNDPEVLKEYARNKAEGVRK